MDHSYEETRQAALDILSGREEERYTNNQYIHFRNNVADVLKKREERAIGRPIENFSFSKQDDMYFQEVFWDLFRQGIITLGTENDPNQAYPFFRLSSFGQQLIESKDVYFFHDLSSYEALIRENIPDVDDLTLFYLKEAMQAFIVGCRLSSAVMLGVTLEYTLDALYDTIGKNATYASHFTQVTQERTLLKKFTKFRNRLNEKKKDLPNELQEDLDTNLDMIVSLIRNYRNESGHPSGKVLSREQCYVNLQLFVPCCKKIYDLRTFFIQ